MRAIFLALAALLALLRPSSAEETVITILTGGTSGIFYPLGMALSSIYGNAVKGVSFTVQSTSGSVENLRLLESGDGELAFTLADTLADAWLGNKDAGFSAPLVRLRGVARLYPNYVHLVASKEFWDQDSRGSQGQARVGRGRTIGHRTQCRRCS